MNITNDAAALYASASAIATSMSSIIGNGME